MSKSMTSKMWAAMIVVSAVALVAAVPANAALVLDLRFADGTTTKEVTALDAGTNIVVEVWAKVTGATLPYADDGLTHVHYAVKSLQGASPLLVGAAGVGFTAAGSAFDTAFDTGGTAGTFGSLVGSADTIGDVGSTGTTPTGYRKPRGDTQPVLAGGLIGRELPGGGWEFRVDTLNLHLGNLNLLPGAKTSFNPTLPNWTFSTATSVAIYRENGQDKSWGLTGPVNGAAYSMGSPVTLQFTEVPEPATMAFLAIGGLMMAGSSAIRRRRAAK